MKYKMISKETDNSNYVFEFERFGNKIIKIYSKSYTNNNLNCELYFDDGIPEFLIKSFTELLSKVSIDFLDGKVIYFDKTFNMKREIKLLSTKGCDEYYLLNDIADIKVHKTKEIELKELNLC